MLLTGTGFEVGAVWVLSIALALIGCDALSSPGDDGPPQRPIAQAGTAGRAAPIAGMGGGAVATGMPAIPDLEPPDAAPTTPRDAGVGVVVGDAGSAVACASEEICNGSDDDCDGASDEDTQRFCHEALPHTFTRCLPFEDVARCVMISCEPGFANCDGDPSNGCENSTLCE